MNTAIYTLNGCLLNPVTKEKIEIKYKEKVYKASSRSESMPGLVVEKTQKTIETPIRIPQSVMGYIFMNDFGDKYTVTNIVVKPVNILQRYKAEFYSILSLGV